TQWRELLLALKELQDAGIHFLIESFGPFGQPQHGCHRDFSLENIFACYKVGLGTGYTTVPTGGPLKNTFASEASALYYTLAHKAVPDLPLFTNGKRIDELWTPEHKRALADYNRLHLRMYKRILQEHGQSVLWHDQQGKHATLWNFAERRVRLPGRVRDLTASRDLPRADRYRLEAGHTYGITGAALRAFAQA